MLIIATLFSTHANSQVVNYTSSYNVPNSSAFTALSISGNIVSITSSQNSQVIISVDVGQLKLPVTTNLTAPNGYSSAQWAGNNEIAFSGTVTDVNNALASLEYKGSGGNVTLHALPESGAYDETNQKYYVLETTGRTWTSANNYANTYSIRGQSGHLATITSVTENNFITNNLPITSGAWLGGSDAAVEDDWRWVTGPENGTLFFRGRKGNHNSIPGVYHNFHWSQPGWPPEPDDYVLITTLGDWADENEAQLYESVIELNASSISFSIVVPVAPTISKNNITKLIDDPPFTFVNPSSASSGAFSYSSSNSSVATISGNTVTIHDTGSSVITVTQAAAGSYLSATTTFTLTVTENPNDPEVAFETIKNEITNLSESTAVSSSLEQVKNAEFVMREKMVFHGEMMRSTPTIATSSFIDYDVNVDADSHQFFGDGHYHQTDIVGGEFRQRLMIDGKIIHSKNNSKTHVFSALALYDFGISKETSQQYRIGFKRSIGDGKHPISFKSKSASGRIGTSLSHSFSDKIFGGVYADIIYSETKSVFYGDVATVNSKINTISTTGGAQISGQEQVNSTFWINPSLSISYNKDHLMKKRFVSKTVLGSSVVDSPVSMATVLRVTAEPEFLFEGKADSKGSQNFTSLNPSYACESMKTGKRVSKCNSGIFFQVGKKNNEKNITGKFSFSYENLNGGVKHEYGLKLKADF